MTLHSLACAALLAALTLLACSQGPMQAGGSSHEGEARTVALAGRAMYDDERPAAGAIVRVRSADFLAAPAAAGLPRQLRLADSTVTDASGRFMIDSVDPGVPLVEINDRTTAAALVRCTVSVQDTMRTLPTGTLQPYAAIGGSVTLPADSGSVYAQIYGLQRSALVDRSVGTFAFTDLPAGSYTVRVASFSAQYGRIELQSGAVAAGSTTMLPAISLHTFADEAYAQWPYSRRLIINTAAAGVNEDVHAFPLLVRLDSSSFDFAQAAPHGIDLRFSSSGAAPLRCQIEQWDPVMRQAVIWVLVDTIRGANDSQFVTMHWGKPDAADFSDGAAVFDTVRFAGVWHLGGAGYGSDATRFRNNAVDYGTRADRGVIGQARYFDGAAWMSVADAASLEPAGMTLSCWFSRDGVQPPKTKLVNKGDTYRPYMSYTLEFRDTTTVAGFQVATQADTFHTLYAGPRAGDREWHFLAGTYDSASGAMRLYLDGAAVDSAVVMPGIEYYTTVVHDLIFGSVKGTQPFYRGTIDETVLARTALSPAWIKLCAATQRPSANIVTFR